MDRLHHALTSAQRMGKQGALMFIDMDNFKTLNDTLGHDQGDLLLQQVAERLAACVRDGDTVARLGGDEFVVILEMLSEQTQDAIAQATSVCQKILGALGQNYTLTSHEFRSTPSIGITLFGPCDGSALELLKQADSAMYQAKAGGRNTFRFFSSPV
jgi:diguanylate cyclase (GGDEF)-like protein